MKHDDIYKQNDQREIENLVQSMPMCQLITISKRDVQIGMFNLVYKSNCFFLHLNKMDEQFQALLMEATAKIVFFDFLCNIPSHWVDPNYGGAATSYYRYAEFSCEIKTYVETNDVAKICQSFLNKYQPEGGYAAITSDSNVYKRSFETLGIVELSPIDIAAKWKLGQNRSIKKRLEIIEQLKNRNQGNDWRAAQEVQRWIELYK